MNMEWEEKATGKKEQVERCMIPNWHRQTVNAHIKRVNWRHYQM